MTLEIILKEVPLKKTDFMAQLNQLGIENSMYWRLVNRESYNQVPDGYQMTKDDCEQLLAGTFLISKPADPINTATIPSQNGGTGPIILQLASPTPSPPPRKKKEESVTQGVVLALILVLIVVGFFLFNFANSNNGDNQWLYLPDNWKSFLSGFQPEKIVCEEGISSSTHIELMNKPIQDKPLQQAKIVATLKDTESCIYFSGSEMAAMFPEKIILQVKLKDGSTKEVEYTGLQIFAGKMAKATAIELGKDPDKNVDDKKWVDQTYAMLLPFLDASKFKTIGEYQYLILPGYGFVPVATPTLEATATLESTNTPAAPTQEPAPVIPPTETVFVEPTALPTDTPLPTNIPRPTLQTFATEVNQALATAMDLYNLTPTVWPTSTDAHNAVTLDFYINNVLNGRSACSPLSANYYTRWAMDNVVTLFMGIDCMDGVGPVYYVQIPADIAARHVSDINFPQIWLSNYPAKLHGPGLDVGGGYSMQPFK